MRLRGLNQKVAQKDACDLLSHHPAASQPITASTHLKSPSQKSVMQNNGSSWGKSPEISSTKRSQAMYTDLDKLYRKIAGNNVQNTSYDIGYSKGYSKGTDKNSKVGLSRHLRMVLVHLIRKSTAFQSIKHPWDHSRRARIQSCSHSHCVAGQND